MYETAATKLSEQRQPTCLLREVSEVSPQPEESRSVGGKKWLDSTDLQESGPEWFVAGMFKLGPI